MKKFYSRLDDLLNENIVYSNENYVSAYTIINTYLKGYKNKLTNLDNYDITEILNSKLNDNLHGYFTCCDDQKKVLAEIYDENNNKLISLRYIVKKVSEPQLDYVITTTETYKDGDIEMFSNVLKDELIKYAEILKEFNVDYDSTHKGMYSVNSIFFLYFVDSEIIIFPSKFNYIDVTINNDDSLSMDYRNMDIFVQAALTGKEEKLLKNVYFNIDDAPDFLKAELKVKRQEELNNSDNKLITKNTPMRRIRNWLKK